MPNRDAQSAGSRMLLLDAASFDDPLARLKDIDVVVQPRAQGRTKYDVEVYSIVRLVGTIFQSCLELPLRLYHGDRPDFLIKIAERSIGIEHTEAITENAAKEAFLRSQGIGPEVYFVSQPSLSAPRKSSKEIRSEIEADIPDPPWEGDSVERDWSMAMAHFVIEKMRKTRSPGFERFDENWLLIYDNWGLPPKLDVGLPMLRQQLTSISPWAVFSKIFVLDTQELIELAAAHCQVHSVVHPD